jgi:hypothetical protein
MPSGHFIPEELPDATSEALAQWMVRAHSSSRT